VPRASCADSHRRILFSVGGHERQLRTHFPINPVDLSFRRARPLTQGVGEGLGVAVGVGVAVAVGDGIGVDVGGGSTVSDVPGAELTKNKDGSGLYVAATRSMPAGGMKVTMHWLELPGMGTRG
jgi:hypothetical protein